jgi:cyclopropane fatty-acyl-phospholipid synthase-like methyltransferase
LVPLSAFVEYFEQEGFSLCSLTDLTSHYLRTLEHWHENLTSNWEALQELQPGVAENFSRYFEIAAVALRYTAKQYAIVAAKSR